jgi:hypothetical protein
MQAGSSASTSAGWSRPVSGTTLPQEAPAAFAQAIKDVDRYSQTSHNPGGSHEHHCNPQ